MQISVIVFVVYQTALFKRQSRYIRSTVPENAEKEAQSLFVTEVILDFHVAVHNSNIRPELFFSCFIYYLKNRRESPGKKNIEISVAIWLSMFSRENFPEDLVFFSIDG